MGTEITRDYLDKAGWTFNGEVWCLKAKGIRFGYREKTNTLIVGWRSYGLPVTTVEQLETIIKQTQQ